MTTINQRMTANAEGDFVVFLIGMRVNRWWKVHQWVRIAAGMTRMLNELGRNPELGFMGGESWFGRTTVMMSYWKSTEHLIAYAKMKDAEHLPAWRAFNKNVGTNGDIGIWHETYRARPGEHETVYVNMPRFGLGRATSLVEAKGHRQSAESRLAARTAPDAAVLPI